MNVFLQGLTLGLAYVAPIGMQNMYVIQSAINMKRRKAYQVALATIIFDILLALACFFGVGTILGKSQWLQMIILGVGAIVVIYIGISLIRSQPEIKKDINISDSMWKIVWTCFAVTWLNPQAIIDGSLLLGNMNAILTPQEGVWFIMGVALASFTWFTVLSLTVGTFKTWINLKILKVINIVCGAIIIIFGLKLVVQFFQLVGLM